MEFDESQEKTEQTTPKRIRDAKEKGHVARSKDLGTALVVMGGVAALFVFSGKVVHELTEIFHHSFMLDRSIINGNDVILNQLKSMSIKGFMLTVPVLLTLLAMSLISPLILGSFIFNVDSTMPNWQRISLIAGFKRMFSLNSLFEAFKAFLKFALISVLGFFLVKHYLYDLVSYSLADINKAIYLSSNTLLWFFIILSCSLAFIASIDVPWQIWNYRTQLKMTRQELKDEMKELEGHPEVKAHIRRMQQKLAEQRMMAEVPKADVIITNPTHYAVALKYDRIRSRAPILIAKGRDLIAEQIKKIAEESKIIIVSAPPFARAIYHSTDLKHEIPQGLYIATAQILAYVFQLKKDNKAKASQVFENLPIPDELRKDA